MARYVQIAMGSGAELCYHLLLSRDLGFLKNEEYADLSSAVDRVMKMLSALSGKIRNISAAQRLSQEPRANGQKPTAAVR